MSTPPAERRAYLTERRQVTALFCDLVDSVTLTVRLDPEDLNRVFDLYLAACDNIVSAHGGEVMQYMGDGVLAYFGYARPADTDAANAGRAARQLRDALGRLALPADGKGIVVHDVHRERDY